MLGASTTSGSIFWKIKKASSSSFLGIPGNIIKIRGWWSWTRLAQVTWKAIDNVPETVTAIARSSNTITVANK